MNTMDRQTRRTYFERLCELRESYERLEGGDVTGVIKVEAMIALVNELFDRGQSPLIAVIDRGPTTA
jgi:hypothetical protein